MSHENIGRLVLIRQQDEKGETTFLGNAAISFEAMAQVQEIHGVILQCLKGKSPQFPIGVGELIDLKEELTTDQIRSLFDGHIESLF